MCYNLKGDAMKRNMNIDIIKIVAVLSVISVHFFKNNYFYATVMHGKRYYFFTLAQHIFMMCVPLFLMATGFLMTKKEKIDKEYIKKLFIRIYIPYLIISFITLLFEKYYLHVEDNLIMHVFKILDFTQVSYAWYVGMYMGLYLLIPFINKLLSKLTKKEFCIYLIILFILGPLTSIRIPYHGKLHIIFLEYFYPLWIINYYSIGYFFKKYGLQIKILPNLLLFLILPFLSYYHYFLSIHYNNRVFYYFNFNNWGGLIPFAISVPVFIFLINRTINIKSKILGKVIKHISSLTLYIYLFSYIFDKIIYKHIPSGINNNYYYFPIIVISVFILSYISSTILDFIYNKCIYLIRNIKTKDVN